MRPILTRRQKDTIFAGIFCVVALLVVLQLWLLTATMNAFMGGDDSVVWPAGIARVWFPLRNMFTVRPVVRMIG